jgi:tRNA (guanine26-N2/guanine27-N2)-dimethyltransferase
MKTIIITEGKTKIETPQPENFRTRAGDYAPSLTKVFYNPLMEFCRDISISVAQTAARRFNGLRVCDPLAGVGVRGIRYANEVKGVTRAVVNDFCREAFELIRKNVTLNGLTGLIETRSTDANILLRENRGQFSFVDLDPFGSPAPFLDAACSSLGKRGMLALTATDTAPLSGTHVKTCLRRYGARPLRTEYCHETGIRILIGFAQRLAGLHEMALTPVLAHATQHYFRIYLAAERGGPARG